MKRKIIFILLLLIGLGTVGFFYLNNIFFPVKFKQIIIDQAQEILHRRVTMENIHLNPLRGFLIENLTISEKDSEATFLHLEEAYLKIIYTSLFKSKHVFIPSITLNNPTINVIRQADENWNFGDLLSLRDKTNLSKIPVIIGGVLITNGTVHFTDQTHAEPFRETIDKIYLKSNISFQKTARFSLQADFPKNPSSVTAEGSYEIPTRDFEIRLGLQNIPVSRYSQLYWKDNRFTIAQAQLTTAHINASRQDRALEIDGSIGLENTQLTLADGTRISGNFRIPQASLGINKGVVKAHSSLYIQNADLQFADQRRFRGNVASNDVDIFSDHQHLTIRGDWTITGAEALWKPEQTFHGDINATHVNLELLPQKSIDLTAALALQKSTVQIDDKTFTGNPVVDLRLKYDLVSSTVAYSGSVTIEKGVLTGVPYVRDVGQIAGKVDFARDKVQTEGLTFVTHNTPLQATGSIVRFADPEIDLELFSDEVNLQAAKIFWPDFFTREQLEVSGLASLRLSYHGIQSLPETRKVKADIFLKNAVLETKRLPSPVSDISGGLSYSGRELFWKNLKGHFSGTAYTLNGRLLNSKPPFIETRVESENLNFTTKLNISRKTLELATLQGTYLNSAFNLSGDIVPEPLSNPLLNIRGTINLELKDLPMLNRDTAKNLQDLRPEGTLNIDGNLKGRLKDWRGWETVLNARSPELILSGLRFKDFALHAAQKDYYLSRFDILTDIYNGILSLNITSDLNQETAPYELILKLEGTDLAKMKADTSFKDNTLSGILSGSASMKGNFSDQSNLRGTGTVLIQNGQIWQMNLMKGLGRFLFIPEFENIVFNEARSDFLITDRRVSTKNLTLKSAPVNLVGTGWIDFDGNVNFYIRSQFSERTINQSASLKRMFTNMFTQGDNFLNIRVDGTLKEPKYVVVSTPINVLERTTDLMIKGIQGIFEEIP